MQVKIVISIIIFLFVCLFVNAQNVPVPLTDVPNEFRAIYKEVETPTYEGAYYNYEYMEPEVVYELYEKKKAEIRSILEGTYGLSEEESETPTRPGGLPRPQNESGAISLPILDQNLTIADRINIYLFYDLEQTWEKYIETRLFYEPLEAQFDIVANWRDGQNAINTFYQDVLKQRDRLDLAMNDQDAKFQNNLIKRELRRNNMLNWLKLKEERVLEDVADYIKDKSGNDNRGTTKVIGRLRKPTPYETVLGEPIPSEKMELIKE